MAKPAVPRARFRGLFAFYAARAHHDHNNDGENRLLKLFGSSDHISDGPLESWSTRTELLSPEMISNVLSPVAREVVSGTAHYNHASDFLHRLLQEIDRKAN
ncbi:hypothetical protein M2427_007531 [Bradyrhizobium sp. BR13661]|jgi:hypothetical protein|nr:hypothetical protein [Bradyrhizobium sp. BR13661]